MGGWAVVALVFVAYAVAARRLDQLSVTAPIALLVTGTLLGAGYLDVLPANPETHAVRLVTELTLALILFADASTIDLRQARKDVELPVRLLAVGLPLTIVLGTFAARLAFPSISWSEAALVAAILAPTDAALGLAVVTNPAVPIRIRRVLNIESGLNDGIATPIVSVLLTMVVAGNSVDHWGVDAALELGRGAGMGIIVGAVGAWVVCRAKAAAWSTPMSEELAVLSVAFLSYFAAVHFSGNGFVAAFVAGFALGAVSRGRVEAAIEFSDTVGLFSSFVVWTVFGAAFVGPVLRSGSHTRPIIYAILSLTVVRMVPVAFCLFGTRLRADTVGFIAWFGPRGLASVVFTLIAFDALGEGTRGHELVELTTWTIMLSVLLHGLSSGPLAAWYGRRLAGAPPDSPELVVVTPARSRKRSLL